jgi:hypothetical protein
MNLYKTSGVTSATPGDTKNQWSGSLADASKDRVAMKKAGLKAVESIPTEVPTDKAGLIAFLNSLEAGV